MSTRERYRRYSLSSSIATPLSSRTLVLRLFKIVKQPQLFDVIQVCPPGFQHLPGDWDEAPRRTREGDGLLPCRDFFPVGLEVGKQQIDTGVPGVRRLYSDHHFIEEA